MRPVRLGLVVEPTLTDLLKAVTAATSYWGGITWPIVPFAHDADACCRIGERFDVDALVAMCETDGATSASRREGFAWASGLVSPFAEDSTFRHFRPMELRSLLATGPQAPACTRVTWDVAHPLRTLLACAFGYLGDDPLTEERSEIADRATRLHVGFDAPWPTHPTPPSLLGCGARGLHFGDWSSAAGFVVVDPDSVDDLLCYWNLRAAGNTVRPWPRRHSELAADVAHDWVKRVRKEVA